MKLISNLQFILTVLCSNSFGMMIYPGVNEHGQILSITCDSQIETACMQICNQTSRCEINESYCRDGAGTQNLKIKRILDGVGTQTIANGNPKPIKELIQILKSGAFTSLHSLTLYNYSSVYDGDQVRAQFRYLCPNLSEFSDKMGILLLSLNPNENNIQGVIGAICPDEKTNEAAFYFTNSRWQLP